MNSKSYSYRYPYQFGKRERAQNTASKISFNTKILVFLAFTLIFRITILTRRRSSEDFAVIDTFAMIEIVIVGLTLFFLLFNPNLKQVLSRISKSSANILFLYCCISIISTLWSPLGSYTLYRSIQVVSQLLVIFIVIYEFNSFESAENFVLKFALLLVIINLLGQFKLVGYNPSLPLLHSNTYSNSALMLFAYCFHEYLVSDGDHKKKYLKYGLLGLVGMILGTSATSNIAAAVSIIFTSIFFYKKSSPTVLMASLLIVMSVFLFSQSILNNRVSNILLAGKNQDSVQSLSGRMYVWETYIDVAKNKPIAGHGFAIATRIGDLRVNTAHNVLLTIALDLGLIGLCIFFWGILRLVRESMRIHSQDMRGKLGSLGVFIAAFVACQSTPFIATHWHAPNAVFGLFLALHTLYLRSPSIAEASSSALAPRHRAPVAKPLSGQRVLRKRGLHSLR